MIVEDDEDILTLYSDYLSKKGYHVIGRYTRGNNIKTNPGKKTGTEVATEILNIFPSAPILFITADFRHPEEIKKKPEFRNKKVDVLIKPVKLEQIEHRIINLVNK